MYRCKTCNSEKVLGKYWVDHNSFKVDAAVEEVNEENWCENCEELVEIYDDELTE